MLRPLLTAAAILVLTQAASAQGSSPQAFVDEVMRDQMLLAESSKTVLDRVPSDDVAGHAANIIAETSTSEIILDSIIQAQELEMPDELDEARSERLLSLTNVDDAGMALAYARIQVAAHEEAIEHVKSYTENGEDEDLKGWAEDQLRTLERGLRASKELEEELAARQDQQQNEAEN